MRNMPTFRSRPEDLDGDELTSLLLDSADFTTFTADEKPRYINDMTTERDIRNQIVCSRKTGREEGLAEGLNKGPEQGQKQGLEKGVGQEKTDIARRMLALGMGTEAVTNVTGLSESDPAKLQ